MAKITIDRDRCKGCLLCITFCPKALISVEKNLNKYGVKPVKFKNSPECPPLPRLRRTIRRSSPSLRTSASEGGCLGCMQCAIVCPDCCIEVYK